MGRCGRALPGFGEVAGPVVLAHGELDGNTPIETALDYCAKYPTWRYVGYPVEGSSWNTRSGTTCLLRPLGARSDKHGRPSAAVTGGGGHPSTYQR